MSARGAALIAGALALACGAGEPRGPCQPSPPPGELGSVCGFANPEDVAWVPSAGLLLVSQMRFGTGSAGGSLAALGLGAGGEPVAPPRRIWPPEPGGAGREPEAPPAAGDPACTAPPDPARFSPHGIGVGAPGSDGEVPVAVVGHGVREAVELFALRGAGEAATLRWTGCLPLPAGAAGNDVVLDAEGAAWVTNYQPAMAGARGLFYTVVGGLGLSTGEVLRWRSSRWESVPGTRGPNPNGLLLLPGGERIAVAYTGANAVGLRPLAPTAPPAHDTPVGGHPDNLTWSARAGVLVPVHTSGLAFLRCRFGALPCRSPWKLMRVDPASGAASQIYGHDGSRIGGVSSVAEVGARLYFGAVFDDRIGVLASAERAQRGEAGRSPPVAARAEFAGRAN